MFQFNHRYRAQLKYSTGCGQENPASTLYFKVLLNTFVMKQEALK